MKKILVGFLFLLGAAEIVWPILSAVRQNALVPLLYRAFDFSKFTEEQQSAIRQFQITAVNDLNSVAYFGLATILIAILLLVVDRKRKPDA